MALCFLSRDNFEADSIHHLSSDLDNNLEIETSDSKIVMPPFTIVPVMMYGMYGLIGKAAQCLSFHAAAARISRVIAQPNAIKSLLGQEWLVVV